MFTYLWNDIYENLVVKSVGLNLFSLLGSSSSSSVDASSCGCVVVLSLYVTPNFVISSLIVGTFKSVTKTLLDIYHGAFTVVQRTLFWYLCNISMFESLAVPQRGIPYVQTVIWAPSVIGVWIDTGSTRALRRAACSMSLPIAVICIWDCRRRAHSACHLFPPLLLHYRTSCCVSYVHFHWLIFI
jgi:hypothetical protein